MFKDNNIETRTTQVFIVNFKHISHFVLVVLLLTLTRSMRAGNLNAEAHLRLCQTSIILSCNTLTT